MYYYNISHHPHHHYWHQFDFFLSSLSSFMWFCFSFFLFGFFFSSMFTDSHWWQRSHRVCRITVYNGYISIQYVQMRKISEYWILKYLLEKKKTKPISMLNTLRKRFLLHYKLQNINVTIRISPSAKNDDEMSQSTLLEFIILMWELCVCVSVLFSATIILNLMLSNAVSLLCTQRTTHSTCKFWIVRA